MSATPPPRPVVGVGVVVLREGRVLVGRRRGSHGAGQWALPGGHLEHGESVLDCAARELREETGLTLVDAQPAPTTSTVFEGRHAVTLFVCGRAEGEPQLLEPAKCEGWAWHTWSALPQPLFPPLAALVDQGWAPALPPSQVQAVRPDREVLTRQRLPYFVGLGGQTVGATGLSMHLVVIPPGARAEPHVHVGHETGIYVLDGRVLTRWGHALEHETVSEAGEFLFVPPGVPHEAVNLSDTEPARAVVARNHPAEHDRVEPWAGVRAGG